jgi:branched-chain amino acid transport system ATP-binding protein
MTVTENLVMGAFHRRTDFEESELKACIELFPRLGERQHQLAGTLSGGEQQMVAICRALWRSRNFCCWTSRVTGLPH